MTFSYYSHSAQVDYRGVATDAPRLKMSHSVTIVVQIYTDQTCFLLHSAVSRQGSNHDLAFVLGHNPSHKSQLWKKFDPSFESLNDSESIQFIK